MKRIGFIGLGVMGAPMAVNLVRAGFEVRGFNRSAAAAARLVGEGGKAADTVADAVIGADAVITMLPDSPDVERVFLGRDGVLENSRPGLLYVDMSTILPVVSRQLAEAGKQRGVRVLDAPVSGGEQGAIEGSLSIMAGGSAEDFAAVMPLLEALGKTVVHVGPAGAGQTVKAANQLIVAGTIELVAEAIVLLEAAGVDTEAAVRVIGGGLAGNRILERKASGMLARQFKPGFRVDLHHKDLGITLAVARELGVVIPLGTLVAELMASLRSQGDGSLDHSALLKVVEQLSGRDGRMRS